MKLFKGFLGRLRRSSAKKLAISAAVVLSVTGAGLAGVSTLNNSSVSADTSSCGSNSGNSIIRGGASSRSALVNYAKSHSDVQKLYASRGLSSNDYQNFINHAKAGVAYDNATIVVDGKVVATNVGSLGRLSGCQGPGVRTFHVAGTRDFYGNMDTQGKAFANGVHAIPVDVLFNDQGQVQFAAMTWNCGNPTYQTPVTPTYACNNLIKKAVGDNRYSFTTNASAGHGATIDHLVYNFGDGSKEVTTTSPDRAVEHTFSKSATVRVTVYVKVPGGNVVKLTNSDCTKQVQFTPPPAVFACDLLTAQPGKQDNQGNQLYTFTAKASAKNADIVSYTFQPGDNSGADTKKSSANTVTFTHTYAPGKYDAKVSVTVKTNAGDVKTVSSAKCAVTINNQLPPASYACDELTVTPGDIAANGNQTFTLTAKASAKNATIQSYTFELGDNSTANVVKTSNNTATTTHQYAPGTYTAKVSVTVKTNAGDVKTVSGPNCSKPVTVAQPGNLACVNLDAKAGTPAADGSTPYTLTATANASSKVTITSYVFTLGDSSQPVTVTTAQKTASTTHTYAPGNYSASVSVNGTDTVTGKKFTNVTAPACAKPISVAPVNSNLACVSLAATSSPVDASGNQAYSFTAKATANNATITSYTFNFGDGQTTPVTTAEMTATTTHTYAAGTTATAYVIVNATDAKNQPISTQQSAACNFQINVGKPTPGLTIVKTVDGAKTEVVKLNTDYEYEVTVTNNGQVDLTNAVVTDVPADGVVLSKENEGLGTIANNQWTYTIPTLAVGQSVTFKFTAQLTKSSTDPVDNQACVTSTMVNNNTPICDHATVTTTPPQVLAASTLVNTGPGSVLAIFGVTAVIGTLAHRLYLSRRLSREG